MGNIYLFFGITLITSMSFCQVGIGTTTPSPASMLEVSSTSDNGLTYAGFMPPRIPDVAARNLINPSQTDVGLIVYLISSGCLQLWNGTSWENIKCSTITSNPPILLGSQNFEIVPANPNLNVIGTVTTNYKTESGPFPVGLPHYVSEVRGYGINNGNTVLTFGPIDASQYTFVIIKFHLASFATLVSQGADADDTIMLSVSTNGGNTYYDEIQVLGYDNKKWGFNNMNTIICPFNGNGNPRNFQPTGSFDLGIGNVELRDIPAGANISFKISLKNNRDEEIWIIDDVEVFGL